MPSALILRYAVPTFPVAILWAPVMALLMSGRDIQDLASLDPGYLSPVAEWLLRFATIGIAGMAGLLAVEAALDRRRRPLDTDQLYLLCGFLAFYAGTTVVPGIFGAEPALPRPFLYVLLLFLAVHARRNDGVEPLLDLLKWALLGLLLVSFAYAILRPHAALRYYAAELRLPLIPFRFWGVGSNANAIGPMALVLTLLVIARPFARRWLDVVAHGSAAIVIVLAQSQTTWIAFALIVPAMLLYRRALDRGERPRLRVSPGLVLALLGLAGMAAVLGIAAGLDSGTTRVEPTAGLTGYGEALTGRGNIWRIAVRTFLDHPIFGYGPTAWTVEFRQALRMPFATSAHNQVLQALSVGGILGGAGLLVYLAALVQTSIRRAAATNGLAPALLVLTLLRCLSETPLDLGTLLYADMVFHVTLFALLLDRTWFAPAGRPIARQ